jgi:hypothetical protein
VHLADIGDMWIESLDPPIITARAVAPLHQLIGFVEPLVAKGAKALFLKGQDVEAELTEATKYWSIQPRFHSSRTGGHGWIVELDRSSGATLPRWQMAIRTEIGEIYQEDRAPHQQAIRASCRSPTRRAALARPPPRSISAPLSPRSANAY